MESAGLRTDEMNDAVVGSNAATESGPAEPDAPAVPEKKVEETAQPAAKPPLTSKQRAEANIELIRKQINDTRTEGGFFGSLFGDSETPLDLAMLQDLDDYLTIYGKQEFAADAWRMKAFLHERNNRKAAAVVDWMALMWIYPKSTLIPEANKQITALIKDAFEDDNSRLKSMLMNARLASGEQGDRWLSLLESLSQIKGDDFNKPIAELGKLFLVHFPDHVRADHAQAILADHLRKDDMVAIFHYSKLLSLYPQSRFRPASLLAIADIQREGLKAYTDATVTYRRLIDGYPDAEATKQGYENLALTYYKYLQDYENALNILTQVVNKFPNDPAALRSLKEMGEIYRIRTKQYELAIKAFRDLAGRFPGEEALVALGKASDIARSSLKDYPMTIEINDQIIRDYHDDDKAVAAMFENAQIYEDKLDQKSKAIEIYQQVVNDYPNDSHAKRAQRQISKLER